MKIAIPPSSNSDDPADAASTEHDVSVAAEVNNSRSFLSRVVGNNTENCLECGEKINELRLEALPGCNLCFPCQSSKDKITIGKVGYSLDEVIQEKGLPDEEEEEE